jgi:SAM-dependent methyltransferase
MSLLKGPQITKIYGAEPCVDLHEKLQSQANGHNLQDRYQILAAGASTDQIVKELLRDGYITSYSEGDTLFDTIICVRALCSISDPQTAASELYKLLRPGGRMLICEHVANPWTKPKGSIVARIVQQLYMICGWAFFIGDCRLNQDTARILLKAAEEDGGWEENNLEMAASFSPFPYLHGVLVKRS